MSRTISRTILITVILVWLLAIGFLVALPEGFVPKTLRQLPIALLIVGPVLLFGEAIVETLLGVAGYAVGRVVLPIGTFGLLRPEGFQDTHSFPWYGITRNTDGRYVASTDATGVLGLIILALAVVIGAVTYAFTK